MTVNPATPPSVSITSPANNSTVTRKSNVMISASATAGTNPISRVDFLIDNSVRCSDTTVPYTCSWNVPAGGGRNTAYSLQAKAYDTTGMVGSSSIVTVTTK